MGMNTPPEIVGPAEMAELLAVDDSTVRKWRLNPKHRFPDADYQLANGKLWLKSTVVNWGRATGRI